MENGFVRERGPYTAWPTFLNRSQLMRPRQALGDGVRAGITLTLALEAPRVLMLVPPSNRPACGGIGGLRVQGSLNSLSAARETVGRYKSGFIALSLWR